MGIKYRVKLLEGHTAKGEQTLDGYLYDPWVCGAAEYSHSEAIKKAKMFGGKAERIKAIKHVCYSCGMSNMSFSASARWDVCAQGYVITGIHDQAYCDNCNDDCRITWEEV